MGEYAPAGSIDYIDRGSLLKVLCCERCGAIIRADSTSQHDQFHRDVLAALYPAALYPEHR